MAYGRRQGPFQYPDYRPSPNLGQITARIGRAWIRPRTPIGAESFACLVQIEQDDKGTVKEVTLKHCNGDTRWQLSLVHAIESASPLPAPPDPTVFTKTITVEMDSEGYSVASRGDSFEPEVAGVATAAAGARGSTR
jgi:hypothetical protein